MAELSIIQAGEKAKYIVTSQNLNFNMEECDFYVELLYGRMGKKLTLQKSDFLYGTGSEWVMMFDTTGMVGKVTARMVWQAHDTDSNPNNQRQEVDEQIIAFVVTTPNPQLICCPKTSSEGHDVRYERTEESDIAALYVRLRATEVVIPDHGDPYTIYRPLITRNDEYLYALRETAEQIQEALSNLQNNNQ